MITIHSIHIGQPQTITDESGVWQSSIFRQPVPGPLHLGLRGLAGDKVTDKKNHGSPDQAVCCHSFDHYSYWNNFYQTTTFAPGGVGENWTLLDADEGAICVGDVYKVGSARVQVSGPRMPCTKPARKLQRPDLQKRTLETLRTGFYLRVITPGMVEAGDQWQLEEQPNPTLSLYAVNHCAYHEFDPALAHQLINTPQLATSWVRLFRRKQAS